MNIVLILIILLLGSFVTLASGNKYASKVAMFFALIAAAYSIVLTTQYYDKTEISSFQWLSSLNLTLSFKVDGLSLLMLLLNCILLPIILLSVIKDKIQSEKIFYSLVLFMSFAMAGVFLSCDALLYYIFWELSLIPIYFIVIMWGNGNKFKRKASAMTFFIYTFAGSLFMLATIIYLYCKTGSFLLQDFYEADLTSTEQIWIFLGFFFAYAIKIPIFPFHTWQANVYQKAPLAGTLLLGALMSKMGLYSVIRWQLPISSFGAHTFQYIALALSIAGVLYGSIITFRQNNLKRLFAYASLAHVGFIAAGIYSLTFNGLLGAVILMLAHGFVTVGLFLSSEIIYKRTGAVLISNMGGFKSFAPKFTIAFLLMVLASITLPISFNFIGEFTIMYGLYEVSIWYTLLIGLSMFLGAFYMLRMYQYVMLGQSKIIGFNDLTLNEVLAFALLTIVLVFFGLYSKPIVDMVSPSLQEILMYINR